MRVLELLRIVRSIANLPNFGDEKATRDWLSGVIDAAWSVPGSSLDDAVMAFLGHAVRNDEYDSLYRLLIVCLTTDRALMPDESALAIRPIAARAIAAGVKPETVLTAVEGIASMVRLIRAAASHSSAY